MEANRIPSPVLLSFTPHLLMHCMNPTMVLGEESSGDMEEGPHHSHLNQSDEDSLSFSDAEEHSWHSPYGSNCAGSTYNDCRVSGASGREIDGFPEPRGKSCLSDSSLDDDPETGASEVNIDVDKIERDCRICHLSLEKAAPESGAPIVLGCSCKDDLAAAHKQCAETWFKIKGNKICEICCSTASNVVGVSENEPSEQWNEANTSAALPPAPSSEARSFWQGHRFLKFLLACLGIPCPRWRQSVVLDVARNGSLLFSRVDRDSPTSHRRIRSSPAPMLASHPLLQQLSLPPRPPPFQFSSSYSPRLLSFRALSCFKPLARPSTASAGAGAGGDYNRLIQSLCAQGHLAQAVQLLPHEHNPSQRTYEALILACGRHNAPSHAAAVHRHLIDHGLDQEPFLSTRLIDMYSHLDRLNNARYVFDRTREKTIFVWNALLKALALADQAEEALALFREMGRLGVPMDSFTCSYVLKACIASSSHPSAAPHRVKQIHAHFCRHGFASRVYVVTTLIDCYAKLGSVAYSERVFNGMIERNVVSWSAMISCYAKNERPFDALELFREMMVKEPETVPNAVMMVNALQACAGLAALGQGKVFHAYILRNALDSVLCVVNALIAMYSKCGSFEMARRIFDRMSDRRDVVTWNSMISAYGVHGFGEKAIQVFHDMISAGVSPSPITFVSVLGACSHAGLIDEGKRFFESMSREHGISPRSEHYACIVDLLGRAGRLDEAVKIIEGMRIEPGPTVWGSLLGACRIHCNVELAERACVRLFELEPVNAGNYVLLADIYAEAKMWEEVTRVRKLLEAKELQKVPGCSWIEVKKKLYSFVSVDEMNPQIEQLHALLVQLVNEMKNNGYVPNTKIVLYDLEPAEKERILLGHSEKLAVAFGLINSGSGEVIRITKNLRLCEDCHSVTKFISKFSKREILVRDVNRFHHFKDGVCSCSDYW
ncbi:PPR repeat [Musa troglodytarum]|uniref:PPR repeat n=1 Tax=Musa troglodytarum TaxID=320322 RepID=A0A9E7F204_9LILI|nr:PPR repeat [Musa troglodytarum]